MYAYDNQLRDKRRPEQRNHPTQQVTEIRDECCCQTRITAGGGPYPAVLSATITGQYIIQQLANLEWFGTSRFFEDGQSL